MANNYRPISLVSVVSKVMEKAINIEILKYLESNKIISDRQYGFRQQRSTGDLLAYVTNIWNSTLEKHGESRVVALDISKAFDRVWHPALINKISAYGLPPGLCRLLTSFLDGRTLQVVVDGISSETFPINAGVPQGSVLSPTLFLIHINDLLASTSNPIYSYADDSNLVSTFSSNRPLSSADSEQLRSQQTESINRDIGIILEWGSRNLVDFNAGKTQAAVFSRKVSRGNENNIIMDGKTLSSTSTLSILGVNVSTNFSWHDHVRAIAKSASRKLGFLFRAKKYFTPHQLLTLYKAQVRPTIEYCSHIWSSAPKHTLALLESIQKRAIRLVGDERLTETLQPLEHRRLVRDLSLFYRYYHGK